MLGPVNEVGRRECIQEYLLVVGGGVGGKDPIMLIVNDGLGIGIPTLE